MLKQTARILILIVGLSVTFAFGLVLWDYASSFEVYRLNLDSSFSLDHHTPLGILLQIFAVLVWAGGCLTLIVVLYGEHLGNLTQGRLCGLWKKCCPFPNFFHVERRLVADRRSGEDRRKVDVTGYNGPERRGDFDRRSGKGRRVIETAHRG